MKSVFVVQLNKTTEFKDMALSHITGLRKRTETGHNVFQSFDIRQSPVYILLSSVKCVPCQLMSGIYGREF